MRAAIRFCIVAFPNGGLSPPDNVFCVMRTGFILRGGRPEDVPLSVVRRRRAGARAQLSWCPAHFLSATHWTGGKWMRSECTAPQFISSYAWKLPPARPAIFERASKLIACTGQKPGSEAEHPSIPWKAYLATREFQHLASDVAEAIFNAPPRRPGLESVSRPASLILDARVLPENEGEPRRGLLAPALPQGAAASQDAAQSRVAGDVPIAA